MSRNGGKADRQAGKQGAEAVEHGKPRLAGRARGAGAFGGKVAPPQGVGSTSNVLAATDKGNNNMGGIAAIEPARGMGDRECHLVLYDNGFVKLIRNRPGFGRPVPNRSYEEARATPGTSVGG